MKLKGIKPIEQHFEKLIVVALSAVFMLVLLMQFIVQPNMVEVGKLREATRPGSAFTAIEKQALKLKAAMTEPNPTLPDYQKVDIASDFRLALSEGISPRKKLATGITGRIININKDVTPVLGDVGGGMIATFVPLAPTGVVLGSVTNTLSPLDVQRIPGLADYVPAQQPYDKNVVTVEATFDGMALQEMLRTDPDGVGPIVQLRRNWWQNKVQILKVRLEREELTLSGEWTNLTVIPDVPGAVSLIEKIDSIVRNTSSLESLASQAAQPRWQSAIRQPAYLQAMAGPEWKPPTELAEDAANKVDQFTIDVTLKRLKKAEEKLVDIEKAKEEREAETGIVMQSYVRRVKDKKAEVEDLKDELRAMGHVFVDDPADLGDQFGADAEADKKPLLENDSVRIWAHDITTVPGVTYRYRIGVVMNNPVYGRHAGLNDNQKALADNPLAIGEMSEWTDPAEVDRMEYYFVTSASGSGQGAFASGSKATADVFRFYYGFWRKGTTGLKPGDLIVASVATPENLYTFDFNTAPKDRDTGFVTVQALAPPELDEDGNPMDPPDWFVPVEARMVAAVDAQFLDVYRIPAESGGGIGGVLQSRPKFQAVLEGGPLSELYLRNPVSEKVSERYLRLKRSAKLGETQGQPVVTEQRGLTLETDNPTDDPELGPGGGGG